jgi:hypothetical protein
MSEAFLNQITLDCLLNKEMYNKHLRNKKLKQTNKEERKFYRKRTYNLFKEIINGKPPKNLAPDIKYAYDTFVNAAIMYFKTIDCSDIIQSEYNGCDFALEGCSDATWDASANIPSNKEADVILMRSIKINPPTLDKFVKRTSTRPAEKMILPQQREINLNAPELKNKGVKNNNTIIYEEKNTNKKTQEKQQPEKNNEK